MGMRARLLALVVAIGPNQKARPTVETACIEETMVAFLKKKKETMVPGHPRKMSWRAGPFGRARETSAGCSGPNVRTQ